MKIFFCLLKGPYFHTRVLLSLSHPCSFLPALGVHVSLVSRSSGGTSVFPLPSLRTQNCRTGTFDCKLVGTGGMSSVP